MGKTLTWSEGSHSDRFLQGRVEFSFSSQVPSKVQKRYTCPCSTARSKVSHRVSGRRACSNEGKLTDHLHTSLLPHPPLSWLEGAAAAWQGKCCTCSLPAPNTLLLVLRALEHLPRYQMAPGHVPGQLLAVPQ